MQPDSETSKAEPTEYTHQEVRPAETLVEPKQETLFVELARQNKRVVEIWDQIHEEVENLGNNFKSWREEAMLGVDETKDPNAQESLDRPENNKKYYFESADENGEKKGWFVQEGGGYIRVGELKYDQTDPSAPRIETVFRIHPWWGIDNSFIDEETKRPGTSFIKMDSVDRRVNIYTSDGKNDPLAEGKRILNELKGSQLKGVIEQGQNAELITKPLPSYEGEGPGQIVRFAPHSSDTSQNSQ